MEERTDRFYGAAVAAAFIVRPDGRAFFVCRGGKWTLATGHLDPTQEQNLKDALSREMSEEVFSERMNGGSLMTIGEILGVVTREEREGKEAKIITIFLCGVSDLTAKGMRYKEEGEEDFIWLEPKKELLEDMNPELLLDQLGQEAVQMYLDKQRPQAARKVKDEGWFGERLKLLFKKTTV